MTEKTAAKPPAKVADPKPEPAKQPTKSSDPTTDPAELPEPTGQIGGLEEERRRQDLPIVIAPGGSVNERIELAKIRLECIKLGQEKHGAYDKRDPLIIAQNYYDWISDPESRIDEAALKPKHTPVDLRDINIDDDDRPAGNSGESAGGAIDHSGLNRG